MPDASRLLTREELLGLTVQPEDVKPFGLSRDCPVTLQFVFAHWPEKTARLLAGYLRHLSRHTANGVGLIFEGVKGDGKTSAMALIAGAETLRRGMRYRRVPNEADVRGNSDTPPHTRYITLPTLADFCLVRNTNEAWERAWRDLFEVPHLMLDEVGTAYWEGFAGNRLFELLDTRLTTPGKVTHMATNGTVAQLKADPVTDRIYDRLSARDHILQCPSVNLRRRRPAEEFTPECW